MKSCGWSGGINTRACFRQYMEVSGYLDSPFTLFQEKERSVTSEGGFEGPFPSPEPVWTL